MPRSFVCGGMPLMQGEFVEAHEYPFQAFNFIAVAPERPLGRRMRGQSAPVLSERVRVSERSRVA